MLNFTRLPTTKTITLSIIVAIGSAQMTGCGYNKLQEQDVSIESKWSEVVNQYQRRADLIPNLVKITKQYAKQEKEIFTQVAEARSQAGSIKLTAEQLSDPEAIAKFTQAQAQLGGALSKLLAVSENYPQLKSDKVFLNLQDELAGTENRITTARNRYIESVGEYNITVRKFPSNITAKAIGMDTKATFKVENEQAISTAPSVSFDDK